MRIDVMMLENRFPFLGMHTNIRVMRLVLIITLGIQLETYAQALLYPSQPLAVITTGNVNSKPLVRSVSSNADYSRKVNVRVSDVLTRQRAAAEANSYGFRSSAVSNEVFETGEPKDSKLPMAQIVIRPQNSPPANALILPMANSHSVIKDDRSWPPEHAHEFARVDVRVMGQKMDTKALLHLTPSSDAASIRKLRKILGRELQSDWMSVDPPPKDASKSPRSLATISRLQPDKALLSAVENLNFTVYRPAKGSDVVVPIELTAEQIGLLKDWLIQRATCRMNFIWEDLGPLFWPRWIRRGICTNSAACSWPPGMRCRPSGSRSLKLLRWACSDDPKQSMEPQKRWLRDRISGKLRLARHSGPAQGARRRTVREERRSRRVRRLIRRLSLSANGYHCEWNPHEFLVSDQCSCGCE